MKIVFDPDISDELKEDIKALVEEEVSEEKCPECGGKEIYVALMDKLLDAKCYDCGYSYAEIEMEEE